MRVFGFYGGLADRKPISFSRLGHLRVVALLAVDDLRSVGGVRSIKNSSAGLATMKMFGNILVPSVERCSARALAGPLPESEWISLGQSFVVPAVGTKSRQSDV